MSKPVLFAGALIAAGFMSLPPRGKAVAQALLQDGGGNFGLDDRVPVQGLTFPPRDPHGAYVFRRAFARLHFDKPVSLSAPPDDTGRLFVVERSGRIFTFQNREDVDHASLFLDLSALVSQGIWEEGLLGLAFAPDFATSSTFYAFYTTVQAGQLRAVVSRFKVLPGDADRADPDSLQEILSVDKPSPEHNGGMLAFGPDGMLYVGLGDGGGDGDPFGNAQNTKTLLGSILRIDPSAAATYRIPPDNPFAGRTDGTRGEIWAYGFRNPWRFSFDRATGRLWAGDVGEHDREEIDVVEKGGNYGWPYFEGQAAFKPLPPAAVGPFLPPVYDYTHETGWCVIGGYVYRGQAIPSLNGTYIFGDFGVLPSARPVWGLTYDAVNGRMLTLKTVAALPKLTAFGEDAQGELYGMSLTNGYLYRLAEDAPGEPLPPVPRRLSDTGLFQDPGRLIPSPGLVAYDVNVPFWSDGVKKSRWIALPGREKITYSATGPWTFPVGTVFVKHFEAEPEPGHLRPIETRVFLRQEDGWRGYSYAWRADGSDADLLDDGKTVNLPWPGGPSQWTFPSRDECLSCHTEAAGFVLGVRSAQLQRTYLYDQEPPHTDNQLRAWNHIGLFDRQLSEADIRAAAALVGPEQSSAGLAARARSYLDGNCAHCHRPGGVANSDLDLRATTPDEQMHAAGVAPAYGDLGITDATLLTPGDKEKSLLWLRMSRRSPGQMPPLASHVVDAEGAALIGQWIEAMTRPE